MIQGIERHADASHANHHDTPPARKGTRRRAAATAVVAAAAAAVAFWPTTAMLYTPGPDRSADLHGQDQAAASDIRVASIVRPGPAPTGSPATPSIPPTPAATPVLLMPGGAIPRPDTGAREPAAGSREKETRKERAMARELAALRQQLAAQRSQLAELHSAKAPMLRILDAQSRQGVAQAEKVIALTGLDLQRLLREQRPAADGGLRAVVGGFRLRTADGFDTTARTVALRVERWHRLQQVLKRLPLIAPLDHYRKSSDFGERKHPVTGRVTMHNGTDFAYYRGAPVRATAAGKVVFAGRRGGFGNLVEIDHGQGIRTRYAHLHKRLVEKGDTVTFRQQIGELGTTGRSTGPHVHYEIMVRGRAVNPMRFVTAGKYAFKPVPKEAVIAVRNEDEKRDGEAARKKAEAAESEVDAKPRPRAAASMADRPAAVAYPLNKAGRKTTTKKKKTARRARPSRAAKRRAAAKKRRARNRRLSRQRAARRRAARRRAR